ncbi:type III polyketide synthase [Candidatus Riflebacteria bacterium]
MKNHSVRISAIATANPPLYVTQEEAYTYYNSMFDLSDNEMALYRKLLLDSAIDGRYVGMDTPAEIKETDPDELNRRFLKHGRKTGAKAVNLALKQSGLKPEDIGGIVVNSCTGYLCPGLSSYIFEDIGFPSNVQFVDLMGIGCGGALPNLSVAAGMLAGKLRKPVISLSVEICTATLFMGNDPGLIVSNSIFGDGASAAILVSDTEEVNESQGVALVDYESGLFPRYRSDLQYRMEDHRLRNVLSTRVPTIGAKTILEVATRLLDRNKLTKDQIKYWAVHSGGTAVLEGIGHAFGLKNNELCYSYEVFKKYGNMSSPSVMFVLQNILEHGKPEKGQYGLLLAFGAGFSAFAILLRF